MNRSRRILRSAVLALAVGIGFIGNWAGGATAQDWQRSLYEDKERFDQLSGAARNLLESRYGKGRNKEWLRSRPRPEPLAQGPVSIAPTNPWETRDLSGLEEPLTALGNTLVNNPAADISPQDTQNETTIVLGAGSTVIVGFNDTESFIFPGGNQATGFSQSSDGGNSFIDRGALPDSASGDGGDPVLARDATSGTIYFSTITFSGSGMQVFRSFDNGASFTAPVNGAPGFGGGDFADKEWMAVDNFPGAGQGNVYLVFRNFGAGGPGSRPDGIYLTRSTDGGTTWTPSGGLSLSAAGQTQGAFVTVGADHAVYVFWWQCDTLPCRIMMRKSTDLAQTFGSPVTVASLLGAGMPNGDLGLEFRTDSLPRAAVNPVSGHLYVVFSDKPVGADRADIFFMRSTDGGATWTPRVRVNDDATPQDQWQPALTVTPDGSRLFIAFYDRRLDPANFLIDTFGVIGGIDGGTGAIAFGPNFRITTQSFPPVFAQDPALMPGYMGDYDMAAADSGFFYYTWGDNRLGNAFHAHQPDVRFAKIPVNGPGPILSIASTALTGGNGNGAIDVNECNTLNVTLRNLGTGVATGVSATLAFNSAGVTLAQAGSAYPNIAVGGLGTNLTPFKISTAPGFACGSNIDLTLTVTTAGGDVFVLPLGLASGSVGLPMRFDNNTVLPIPDANPNPSTVESTIAVSGITTSVKKVTVSLYITHTFDSDLEVSLVAPDGTTVPLTINNGGSGENYGAACSPDGARTTFDDSAATSITTSSAPFVGTFRPQEPLSALIGKSGPAVNGTWKLRISDDFPLDTGTLHCWSLFISPLVCGDGGGTCNLPPIVQPKLGNISTRGPVGTGDNVMIGGFIIQGTTPKTVVLRGRGPSLGGAPFFVPGTLSNPLLKLFSGPTLIAQNDDWQGPTDCAFACGGPGEISAAGLDPCQPNPGQAGPPPGCNSEAALLVTLPPGAYTALLSGASGETGVGLVEVFEVDGNTTLADLHNISTRGVVGTGDNIMIGGFVVEGSSPKTVVVRGRGPSLGAPPFFVPGVLSDPFLRVFSGATAIAQNNNWQDAPTCNPGFACGTSAQIMAAGLDPCQPNPGQVTPPPNCSLESVILITLPPGAYTVLLSGASGETGVGLIEVFEVN